MQNQLIVLCHSKQPKIYAGWAPM